MSAQVNGYYCRDCADVALAQRGIDPAQPRRDEQARRSEAAQRRGENQPGPAGSTLGSRLNLYA
ncbi:MAG TPA: hypothetical protein VMG12_45680 [Polyangiaceae bacterium]|nr:hypothetical protein [Polyangiaceae bacterium]